MVSVHGLDKVLSIPVLCLVQTHLSIVVHFDRRLNLSSRELDLQSWEATFPPMTPQLNPWEVSKF